MKEKIKTKDINKDIKVFDKTATVTKHMKDTYIKTKEGIKQDEQKSDGFAVEHVQHDIVHMTKGSMRQVGKITYQKIRQRDKNIKNQEECTYGETAANAEGTPKSTKLLEEPDKLKSLKIPRNKEQNIGTSNQHRKKADLERIPVEIKRKAMDKTSIPQIKNAYYTNGLAIKTRHVNERIIERQSSNLAARKAQKSMKMSWHIDKIRGRSTRSLKKFSTSMKAAVTAAKDLISMIAAGGWVVILILVVVILFCGALSDVGGGSINAAQPVSQEVQQYEPLIQKYAEKHGIQEYVELIKAVMMQESGGQGKDPMQASECGYNKKYPNIPNGITNPEYSIDVGIENLAACLAQAHVKSPFDMRNLKTALQGYNYGNGYISWAEKRGGYTSKNAAEFSNMMANKLGWSNYGDKEYVPHVLRYYPYNDFGQIPSGGGSQVIVQIALKEEGNINGNKFWSWYGFNSRVEWCACFVSWCADKTGYLNKIIPKFAACMDGAAWFKNRNQWKGRNYTPRSGDIIFFNWDGDGKIDHVGIVVNAAKGVVNTIEGNSRNACKRRTYDLGSSYIAGYGIPRY